MDFPGEHCKNSVYDIIKACGLKNVKISLENGCKKGDSYMGVIIRVKVSGVNQSGDNETINLILKTPPVYCENEEKVFPMSWFYRTEILAYTKVLPVLSELQKDLTHEDRFQYPKLFRSLPVEKGAMLIFEDLKAEGFEMYDRKKAFDYEHITCTVKNLARFHATSIVLRANNPNLYREIAQLFICDGTLTIKGFSKMVADSAERICKIITDPFERERVQQYFSKINFDLVKQMCRPPADTPYTVICHGDSWPNNMLFAYQNGRLRDLRLLDWQMMACGPPILDLSYTMFMTMDDKLREKHYKEILELYYETLSDNVSKMGFDASILFPRRVFDEQIKTTMHFGFARTVIILPLALADDDKLINLEDTNDNIDNGCNELIMNETTVLRMRDLVTFCIKEKII